MLPFHFGPPERRLFGLFHPAAARSGAATALLLCNPFGQEAVRTHRIYRVLAERAMRLGLAVLRFDYYGSGDSDGADTEGHLAGWAEDVATASQELLARAGESRLVWLGARLGATVAVRASTLARRRPDELLLWEPIADGRAYLDTLADRLVESLDSSLSIAPHEWHARLAANPAELAREGIGFEIGDRLLAELLELTPASLPPPSTARCVWVHDGNASEAAEVMQRWRSAGSNVDGQVLQHEFDWIAEEALNTALVPSEVVQRLTALVTQRP